MSEDGFLSRWAKRKAEVKAGRPAAAEPLAAPAAVAPLPAPAPATGETQAAVPATALASTGLRPAEAGLDLSPPQADAPPTESPAPPAPTLEDVAALMPGDEISRFVARGVDESVKRAAVKKLFSDPRYNIMDGLDVYIDDYGVPDPIPTAMLRKMNQSKFLGLFAEEEAAEAQAAARLAAAEPGAQAHRPGDEPAADPALSSPAPAAAPETAQDAIPAAPVAAVQTDATRAPDEDPDLQLQPDDAARRLGADIGAGRERG